MSAQQNTLLTDNGQPSASDSVLPGNGALPLFSDLTADDQQPSPDSTSSGNGPQNVMTDGQQPAQDSGSPSGGLLSGLPILQTVLSPPSPGGTSPSGNGPPPNIDQTAPSGSAPAADNSSSPSGMQIYQTDPSADEGQPSTGGSGSTGGGTGAQPGPNDGLTNLLGGADTVVPDTHHLGTLVSTLLPADTLTGDISPALTSVDADTGLGDIGNATAPLTTVGQVADAVVGTVDGATAIPADGVVSDALGVLGNGQTADTSVLPGGVLGSAPVLDASADPSQGIAVDALATGQGSPGSSIGTDALPGSLGNIADVSALAAPTTGDGAIDANAGDGSSVLSADALTGTLPDAGDLLGSGDLIGGSQSSNLVDANALPQSDGDIADASVLTSSQPSGSAIGALVGDGPNLIDASALTGNGALQVADLQGIGVDSLAGALINAPASVPLSIAPAAMVSPIADVTAAADTLDPSAIASHVTNAVAQVGHLL
jgi:hypothetical protein